MPRDSMNVIGLFMYGSMTLWMSLVYLCRPLDDSVNNIGLFMYGSMTLWMSLVYLCMAWWLCECHWFIYVWFDDSCHWFIYVWLDDSVNVTGLFMYGSMTLWMLLVYLCTSRWLWMSFDYICMAQCALKCHLKVIYVRLDDWLNDTGLFM